MSAALRQALDPLWVEAQHASAAAFGEAVRRLLDLHGHYLRGTSESAEADAAREAMDAPWRGMDEADRERLRRLSAALADTEDLTGSSLSRQGHYLRGTSEFRREVAVLGERAQGLAADAEIARELRALAEQALARAEERAEESEHRAEAAEADAARLRAELGRTAVALADTVRERNAALARLEQARRSGEGAHGCA